MEETLPEDKQLDLSLLSDEGLELSVILSDNQGSLDVQNDETVVGKSNHQVGKWKRDKNPVRFK